MIRNRRNSIALCGLLAVFLPPSAQADCSQWNLNGEWTIVQSNDTISYFNFKQAGRALWGRGYFQGHNPPKNFTASVGGLIEGDSLVFTAYWSNGDTGQYEGTINTRGRIKGTGYEIQSPDTIVTWYSRGNAECLESLGSSGSALSVEEPGTLKAQGRVKTGTPGLKLTICEAWRKARDRNSPAATVSGLKAQCLASGELEATEETTE